MNIVEGRRLEMSVQKRYRPTTSAGMKAKETEGRKGGMEGVGNKGGNDGKLVPSFLL